MPKAKSNGAKLKSNGTADADDLSTLLQDTLRVSEDVKISKDLRKVADWISGSSKKKPKVLVLTGAGVSVAAGIPDFRTPGTGLYDNLQSYNLPYPEAVFDVRFYRSNPQPFCALAKEIWPGLTHSPTLTHSFLALLSQKGYLLRNYSQNIDGLEFLAGIPDDELVECHGHFRTASCIDCGASMDGSLVKDSIVDDSAAPQCSRCGGYVKPDIVFFGESLPNRFHQLLKGDVGAADILLVMGTSLQVAPVSLIPSMVNCKRALFNRDLVMRLNGKEDAFVEGDCDSNVRALCKALGWEDELLELNAKTRLRPKQKDENGKKKSKSGGNGGGTTQRRGKRDKAT